MKCISSHSITFYILWFWWNKKIVLFYYEISKQSNHMFILFRSTLLNYIMLHATLLVLAYPNIALESLNKEKETWEEVRRCILIKHMFDLKEMEDKGGTSFNQKYIWFIIGGEKF